VDELNWFYFQSKQLQLKRKVLSFKDDNCFIGYVAVKKKLKISVFSRCIFFYKLKATNMFFTKGH